MKITKILNLIESTNEMTLSQIYSSRKLPDHDERFWMHVSKSDFDKKLPLGILSARKVEQILLSQYHVDHLDELIEMIGDDEDRQELVTNYSSNEKLSDEIIIIANRKIIDGNHRALAAAISKKSIKFVNIDDLHDID